MFLFSVSFFRFKQNRVFLFLIFFWFSNLFSNLFFFNFSLKVFQRRMPVMLAVVAIQAILDLATHSQVRLSGFLFSLIKKIFSKTKSKVVLSK